jgi:WD40 repeat protein
MSNLNDSLSKESKYFLNLPYHLAQANQTDDLLHLLTEFIFLEYKISTLSLQQLVEDYIFANNLGLNISEDDHKILQLIRQILQQSSHVIAKDKTQLPEQLFGRLVYQNSHLIRKLLDQAKASKQNSWLRPLEPSLISSKGALIRVLEGHTQMIIDCSLSDDGKMGVSVSRDRTLRVWNLEKGACTNILVGHHGEIKSCSLSGDGKIVLSASDDTTLRLWDTETGDCLFILIGHTDRVTSCSLSSDGKVALSTSDDSTARVWNVKTGECLLIFDEHTDRVTCCDLSSDGKKALSGSYDQTLKLWDTETGECLSSVENKLGAFIYCSLSGDKHLALSISDVMILENNPENTQSFNAYTFPGEVNNDSSIIKDIDLNELPDDQQEYLNQYLLHIIEESGLSVDMLKENHLVKLWDLDKAECIYVFEEDNFTTRCKLTEDGKVALSSTMGGGKIKFWDTKTGECLSNLSTASTFVSACTINRQGTFAFSASDNLDLRLWDVEINVKSNEQFPADLGELIGGCKYNHDGTKAFSISTGGIIQIWEIQTRICIKEFKISSEIGGILITCSFSSLLESILISTVNDMNRNLYLIDINSGECLLFLDYHTSAISDFAISEDGQIAISCSEDSFYFANIEEKKYMLLDGYTENLGKILSCDLNRNGSIIISAYSKAILVIRNLIEDSFLEIDTKHSDEILKCIISPDGVIAASTSKDGFLKIWNTITGKCLCNLAVQSDLRQFDISNNNEFVLYSKDRNTLQVTRISDSKLIGKFIFDSWISEIAFSPDSTQIMVGDYSGCIHFLQLESVVL